MEQVLTLPGEVERWAHYGTEYVKADDYAALNDYAALVQMERDMARAEVERLRMAEAEAMAVVYSLEGTVERLRGPREPPHCPTCGCGLPDPTGESRDAV